MVHVTEATCRDGLHGAGKNSRQQGALQNQNQG
jgi:hypothetical protein